MFWKVAKPTFSTCKEQYTGKEWRSVQDFQDTVLEKCAMSVAQPTHLFFRRWWSSSEWSTVSFVRMYDIFLGSLFIMATPIMGTPLNAWNVASPYEVSDCCLAPFVFLLLCFLSKTFFFGKHNFLKHSLIKDMNVSMLDLLILLWGVFKHAFSTKVSQWTSIAAPYSSRFPTCWKR